MTTTNGGGRTPPDKKAVRTALENALALWILERHVDLGVRRTACRDVARRLADLGAEVTRSGGCRTSVGDDVADYIGSRHGLPEWDHLLGKDTVATPTSPRPKKPVAKMSAAERLQHGNELAAGKREADQ